MKFENGVTAYMLESSGAGMEVECICERGILRGLNNGESWCAILLSSRDRSPSSFGRLGLRGG